MSLFGRTLVDGDRLEVAGATVRLKVNRRARRVSLRLDRTRREIIATAPSARHLAEAAAFARAKSDWIATQLAQQPQPAVLAPGMQLEVFGRPVRLEVGAGRARWIEPDDGSTPTIRAMGEGEGFARAVTLILRRRALEVLTARTAVHAARLGAPLGHDFCAINLSDNLKPWDLVEHRLRLAARAGFAMAFYNPRSASRPHHFARVLEILRAECGPETLISRISSRYLADTCAPVGGAPRSTAAAAQRSSSINAPR